MDTHGNPELLSKEEYSKYASYIHLSKKGTDTLRSKFQDIYDNFSETCRVGIFSDKKLEINIPNEKMNNLMQIMLEEEDDFRIFNTERDNIFEINTRYLMVRVGGDPNILESMLKEEIIILISKQLGFNEIEVG